MDFYRPPTTQGTLDALGAVYRAVRAWRFYPKGHPSRRSCLELAHSAMRELLDSNTLLLTCGRTGFSFPDGETLKDDSKMPTALAYELFVRRVQKITFSHDLFEEDLLEFCRIMCLSPEEIQQSGGIDSVMTERGIRSIWTNEFDLAAIRMKRRKVEQSGTVPRGIDEMESSGDTPGIPPPPASGAGTGSPGQLLHELLGRITYCVDDDTYLILIRQAVTCADSFRSRQDQHLVFPLLELLAVHACDQTRSGSIRAHALFAIEQIIMSGTMLRTVLESTEHTHGVSRNTLQAALAAGGAAAVSAAVELMGRTASLKARKTLSTSLGSLGETAVPALLDLMHDQRWFITRNICAILGFIASTAASAALMECLHHSDLRVRKEAVRSLAQIGGPEPEEAVLAVLRSTDTALYPQAVASLGGMKSRKSLAELMKIVFSRDLFLKSLSLKIDALASIALIGERQVTPHLLVLLEERQLLAAARGRQLKAAIAVCLGRLGDTRALPALEKLAGGGGELGTACAEAIALIEKTEGTPDGNTR